MLLNININYLASLRNTIGGNEPDILKCARYCERSGADGIIAYVSDLTDSISTYDIKNLKSHLRTRFILKMPMSKEYQKHAIDCVPDIVCIVPETYEQSPSKGFNVLKYQTEINDFMVPLMYEGSLACVLIEPQIEQVHSAYKAGMHYIELNTAKYAEAFKTGNYEKEFNDLKESAVLANTLGLKVILGNGINYTNVSKLSEIHGVSELNIGHSITSKAIFAGLDKAIKDMKELINEK